MSTWFGSKEKDPAAAAKKREEKEQKAVTQLRQLLLSSEGQQAAQQLVQGEADSSDDHRCFCNLVIHGLPSKIAVQNAPQRHWGDTPSRRGALNVIQASDGVACTSLK